MFLSFQGDGKLSAFENLEKAVNQDRSEQIIVEPDIARVTEGLRDTGYDFNTAIADIVDNSIAAGATKVEIELGVDIAGLTAVSIADNGIGMDRAGLVNAMRYGSARRPDRSSLGKFGLGLKTASTAFCRKLVVATKPSGTEPALEASWDLDDLERLGSWSLSVRSATPERASTLNAISGGVSGTVVVWEKIDRLLADYQNPAGAPRRAAFRRLEADLRDHLGLVYQRFLDPADQRAPNLAIHLNRQPVAPWDPFCTRVNPIPAAARNQHVALSSGESTTFQLRAFILPRREEFPTPELRDDAKISNDRQGIYIYRENRLIHGPTWLRMYGREPHLSLLRIELSFTHELDEAFQIDIKKSRIVLNETLNDWLRDKFLPGPRREAEGRYRRGAAVASAAGSTPIHQASVSVIAEKLPTLKTAKVTSVDANAGTIEITNNAGRGQAQIEIVTTPDTSQLHLDTSPTLVNGVLWEPALINGGIGVRLNTGHPFYSRAYLPNKANTVVVQALDYLLWALAQAELNNVVAANELMFEEFRIEVARNLRRLVADLPEVDPSDPPVLTGDQEVESVR